MNLTVRLTRSEIEVVDAYAAAYGLRSRSAAIRAAVRALRSRCLEDDYARAFVEWDGSDDASLWSTTVSDGMDREPRWRPDEDHR